MTWPRVELARVSRDEKELRVKSRDRGECKTGLQGRQDNLLWWDVESPMVRNETTNLAINKQINKLLIK